MIVIEKASIKDLKELQFIAKLTFIETYAAHNTPENVNTYLSSNFNPEHLANELTNRDSEFYFAKKEGEVVGYLKLNVGKAQTDLKDHDALEIERIYVRHDFKGNKIGKAFHSKALEVARELGVQFVWLGVWEKNINAISFYEKMGFQSFDKHNFTFGDEEQTDILMKVKIT